MATRIQKRRSELRGRLLKELERLTETDMERLLKFVQSVRKSSDEQEVSPLTQAQKTDDPIVDLFGIADCEPFADHIDNELYG